MFWELSATSPEELTISFVVDPVVREMLENPGSIYR
jgi:hypothetical protein